MHKRYILPVFVFLSGLVLSTYSCKHDPILMDDVTPIDTTGNPMDTMPDNPTDTIVGDPCDPDVVYFDTQILPILRSNCAEPGCHDEITAQEGVILTSYENVMQTGDVEPFDLEGTEIYERITDDDPEDRMPPEPETPLNQEQINLIARWILQGAENLTCDPNAGGCDTENVSFAADIWPVLQNNCFGCHSGGTPNGGVSLTSHSTVAGTANSGRLLGAISWDPGFVNMPLGGDQLDQCFIDKVEAWIQAGTPDN